MQEIITAGHYQNLYPNPCKHVRIKLKMENYYDEGDGNYDNEDGWLWKDCSENNWCWFPILSIVPHFK